LTITLPSFANDFQKALAIGYVDSTDFSGFRKTGAIPSFLKGMLSQVFDDRTGRMKYESLRDPIRDISTIVGSVRQICLAFKKIELECTPERVNASIEGFVASEHELSTFEVRDDLHADFLRVAHLLWDNLFADFCLADLVPAHGPGATADGISGNRKYDWRRWHEREEPYFHLVGDAFPLGIAASLDELRDVSLVPPAEELPVKVTPVPKTLKGPRIIAIEPVCMQYAQQALRSYLYTRIESVGPAAGHVNFTDQSVNQRLALIASREHHLATVDLSEASDRVPLSLAVRMFDGSPDLKDAILACRSTRAKLPDGRIIDGLAKFASMGSALCFPVESMYFYTICIATLIREQNLPFTFKSVLQCSENVFVYGDDILIPREHARIICDDLQKYMCKVNMNKTYWNGYFRESCGIDAFDGQEVTATYVRAKRPSDKRQSRELISWVKTANQFYKRGYVQSASHMFSCVEAVLGPLPYLPEDSPGLGRIPIRSYYISRDRYNRKLQRFEVKAWVPEPTFRTDMLDGYGALSKCLLKLNNQLYGWEAEVKRRELQLKDWVSSLVVEDKRHLMRSVRFGAVALKSRWVPSY